MTMLDAPGLALATALASMLNGSILVTVLHRRVGCIEWGSIAMSALRVLMACIPVVLICLGVAGAMIWTHEGEWLMKAAILVAGISLSVSGYLGVHIMLGSDELDVVLSMVKRKLGPTVQKFRRA
jgi:putative peptidoglycan lipid II flippase